jgi:CRISPR-associated exonuclease Cas4
MFTEDDLLPLSALQHLLFCERQCALIHVEQLWAENRLTVEGRDLHEKVDTGPSESRRDVRVLRGVPLRSLRLGLSGRADVVDLRRTAAGRSKEGSRALLSELDVAQLGELVRDGFVRCAPVEYKRGKPKRDRSDEVQLCAQALCLEEMLTAAISEGSLFYGSTRRRVDVAFNDGLRARTEQAAARLHELMRGGITPRAVREPKCESCSLVNLCLPGALGPPRSVVRYMERALRSLQPSSPPEEVA